MSTAKPFRRSPGRQWLLAAEISFDWQDLQYGGPAITSVTAKPGIIEINDLNPTLISQGSSGSGANILTATTATTPTTSGSTTIITAPGVNTFNLLELPAGAVVVGGHLNILTAFAGPTSPTLALGLGYAPSAYLAATSMTTAARVPLIVPNRVTPNPEKVVASLAASAVAAWTAGAATLHVQYYIQDRATENQGV